MPREKSRHRDRDRRSSSRSSDSSYDRKKIKKHRRRSKSHDRSESSHRRKRSVSTSRSRKRRSYSRSVSRDRYERSRKRSTSRSRSKRSKRDSRDRSRSRSSSRSRKYRKKSKRSRRSPSSSSHGSSFDIEKPTTTEKPVKLDDTNTKIEKAIKAAEAAGLTMTKIPTYEYKEVEIREEMPTIHDRNLLAELNSDSFVPKAFTSSKSKKHNIVIDLNKETVNVNDPDLKVSTEDSIINFAALPSEEELKEMWVKKLYQYRKKMLKGEI